MHLKAFEKFESNFSFQKNVFTANNKSRCSMSPGNEFKWLLWFPVVSCNYHIIMNFIDCMIGVKICADFLYTYNCTNVV